MVFVGNFQKFVKNRDAVSEVLGTTLMSVLVLIMMSSIAAFVCSHQSTTSLPRTDVQGWVDPYSDTLYLKHGGGDTIDMEDTELLFYIKEKKHVLSPSEIRDYLGKDHWEIGDTITINTQNKWGTSIGTTDYIKVSLVSLESNSVIRKIEMPLEYVNYSPEMELNEWYFFTKVEGDDSANVNLEHLTDYDLNADLSPDNLDVDKYLGKDYTARNPFIHIPTNGPLDLSFGFKDSDFGGFNGSSGNITLLMIYSMKLKPDELPMDIAGKALEINPKDQGSKEWFLCNRTVYNVTISSISELKFNLHVDADATDKTMYIDYLAVRLS